MIGERLSDRYEIVAELGRGGMGMVFRARDPLLERDVAVKVIALAQMSPEAEERFRREAQLVAQMDHPGIVPIFDLGTDCDCVFFVMPVVEGTTLQTLIRGHDLVLGDALEIVAQVAEALDYSHARGVVHRDVKPENVMVTWEDGEPRARVMDFGLALVGAASRLTRTGKLPGTLVYLSPEQILSAEVDGRSDLYSLGTILYECLTGETPFSGSRYSLLYRIAHEPPPPLAARGLDARLAELVRRCLDKRPEERPRRGNELADALRRLRSELDPARRRAALLESARQGREGGELAALTPLAGRAAEAGELRRCLDEALDGGSRLVVVGGEAGLGKTRLLQFVEELARSRGVQRVLRGRFSTRDAFPYQGFGELVQDYFRVREALPETDRAPPELGDLWADLIELFPALREISEVTATGPPALSAAAAAEDHTRIFELAARTLARLAGGRPLVLLLEQLHASEAAIEALLYVVRRLGPTPTLIVGTYRPSELGRRHPLVRLLRGMRDDPRFTVIELEPLAADEHRELLATLLAGSRMSEELVDKLYQASEGNPFFIREWVRWLLETGDLWRDEAETWVLASDAAVAHDALPETIQQAVESRLEQLPEERLKVLRTASILGPAFDFTDLEALAGGDVEAAVEALVREGLLEEEPRSRGDRLVFSSRLVRETLYRGLTRRRRRRLHRRHAEQLEARYAGRPHRVFARLVHHFAEGEVADKTVGYALELARQAVAGFGWEAAIRAARTALELIADDTLAGGGAEAELRRLLAAALRAEGQLETAFREAERAVRAAQRTGAAPAVAAAALLAAEIAWQARRVDETREWIARGLEVPPEDAGGECRIRLLTLAATLANLSGDYARARELRQEAEKLVEGEPGEADAEAVPAGGRLVVALSASSVALDPGAVQTLEEAEVLSNVYETLLTTDGEGNLIPTLCREWEGSSRGSVFRFVLRPEVCFSSGEQLTAADVRRSFERAARLGGGLPAPAFRALAGVEAFLAGESESLDGVRADGDHVVELRLREPLPIFPSLLTDPRTAVSRTRADGSPHLGTGPFRWPRGGAEDGRVVLERNPRYWRGKPPPLERLEFRVLPHAADVARALRAGEIDLGRDLQGEDLEEILRDPRYRAGLVETTQKNVYYVLFNSSGPAARRADLRRALTGVVRVQDIVWRTLGRFAQPATGLIPPGILGHDPGRRRPALTREQARALLAAAGYEADAAPRLKGAVHPRLLERFGGLIQALFDQWAALGVTVDLVTVPLDSYRSRVADPTGLDFCFGRWDLAYDDPDNVCYEALHSRYGRLAAYLDTDAADPWLERARQEVRAAHRQRLYRRIERMVAERALLLPLFHDVRYFIRGPRVRGLRLLGAPPFVNYAEIGVADPDDELRRSRRLPARQSGTLHVPLPEALPSLAPEVAVLLEGAELVPNVFETLTRIDEGAHVVPCLASEFRAENGGRRFRFRLRQNVRFHDGRRLTVRDVRYSFERLLRAGGGAAESLLPIRGARSLSAGERSELAGLRVMSERELVLELEEPLSFFPALLTSPTTAVAPEGSGVFDGNWRHGTAGTGPFRAVRVVPGERVELEANPHYWRRGRPRCDRLIFELGLGAERIAADFRAGALAIASDLRPSDLEELRRDPELAAGYLEVPGFATYYLVLNARRGPLAELGIRQALARTLDVAGAVRDGLGRLASPARGLIPPGLLGRDPRLSPPPPGGEVADLAGVELRGAVHPKLRDAYRDFWRRLTAPLASAGATLESIDRDPRRALETAGVDLVAVRWLADYPDSDSFVRLLHSADGLYGALCGRPQLDRLIEAGRHESDPASRHGIYHEIEELLRREALVVPLFHETVYRIARPEVTGLKLGLRAPVVAYDELALT